MTFTSFNKRRSTIQRTVTVVWLIFFLAASLAHAGGMTLCLEKNEVHVLSQTDFYVSSCHTSVSVESSGQSHPDISVTSEQHNEAPCLDIWLSTYDSLVPSQHPARILFQRSNDAFISTYDSSSIEFQPSRFVSSINSPTYPLSSTLFNLQTIILLI